MPPNHRKAVNASNIKLIQWHLSAYPGMHSVDLVKMIYQAVFGNHHIQEGPEAILNAMTAELNTAPDSGASTRLVDPLSTGSGWIRIHLQPFILLGGVPQSLALAIHGSASVSTGTPAAFIHLLHEAQHLLNQGTQTLPGLDLTGWEARIRETGFAPVHHSPYYKKLYHPVYRVVHASMLVKAELRWITPHWEKICLRSPQSMNQSGRKK